MSYFGLMGATISKYAPSVLYNDDNNSNADTILYVGP